MVNSPLIRPAIYWGQTWHWEGCLRFLWNQPRGEVSTVKFTTPGTPYKGHRRCDRPKPQFCRRNMAMILENKIYIYITWSLNHQQIYHNLKIYHNSSCKNTVDSKLWEKTLFLCWNTSNNSKIMIKSTSNQHLHPVCIDVIFHPSLFGSLGT